ncbi:hypothetical protein MIT9_P2477 [Methylomarinovum caldicuralii]|uniref:Hydroxylamine oxidation protein HaoB n=1 Tax=Methylomarinovum caldicuralii TaxID=438856 RepID=A0AAU9BVT2_9GAMM|nr:hydroxylamine oxidation protein HaoB [Methylomarinovum caldicuralii]BCX82886.1 hypothetical protein MIT9_P2477 [Methylomarinovum caldicuralii]
MRRLWLGGALLLAGAVLIASFFWPRPSPWQVTTEPVPVPASYHGRHPIDALSRWRMQHPDGRRLTLYVARYRGDDGQSRQALVPAPDSPAWGHWQALGETLGQLEPDALILAWWDDAHRVDLLSGRKVWVRQPPADAFPEEARELWRLLSGGFSADKERLRRLARWLTAPAVEGLAALRRNTPPRPRYLLVNAGLLSRVDEVERLTGVKLPLEVRIFPPGDNLHAQIASVQRWAGETGLGYLPRKIPAGIAAWRLTAPADALLLRLLPFIGNPPPPAGLTPVFQTPGRQLQLFRLQ